MTRKATWTNSDGLVVGFGPNSPERDAGGVINSEGGWKEARLDFDYRTATTVSPFGIVLPAGSMLGKAWVECHEAWATADAGKIEIGIIGGDVDALVDDYDEQATSGGTVGNLVSANAVDAVGVVYAAETRIGLTKTNNFTAGRSTLVVQYAH